MLLLALIIMIGFQTVKQESVIISFPFDSIKTLYKTEFQFTEW